MNTKNKNPMFDKNYRDVYAIIKVLSNRKQSQMAEEILQSLVKKGWIVEREASKIMEDQISKKWAGSFYFFEFGKYCAKCSRCETVCNVGAPICLSFDNKPFCIDCLTKDEKKNPNILYTEYLKNKSVHKSNEISDVKLLPDVLSEVAKSGETEILENEASDGILNDDWDLATGEGDKNGI